jgi:hypothetical protein
VSELRRSERTGATVVRIRPNPCTFLIVGCPHALEARCGHRSSQKSAPKIPLAHCVRSRVQCWSFSAPPWLFYVRHEIVASGWETRQRIQLVIDRSALLAPENRL